MADHDTPNADQGPRFIVPLPGGKAARVPLDVLQQYEDDETRTSHTGANGAKSPPGTKIRAGESTININIYTSSGEVHVDQSSSDDDDVVAHSLSVDPTTGTSEWHTDWEYGECDYTDEAGFPQRIQAWHRHPFGTEYTELYEG